MLGGPPASCRESLPLVGAIGVPGQGCHVITGRQDTLHGARNSAWCREDPHDAHIHIETESTSAWSAINAVVQSKPYVWSSDANLHELPYRETFIRMPETCLRFARGTIEVVRSLNIQHRPTDIDPALLGRCIRCLISNTACRGCLLNVRAAMSSQQLAQVCALHQRRVLKLPLQFHDAHRLASVPRPRPSIPCQRSLHP